MTMDFTDTIPPDEVPELDDVTNPCKTCGRQIDVAYGGRGPRPKFCSTCKPVKGMRSQSPRVTGNAQNLASQATGVLVQLNSFMALGAAAIGLFGTAKAIQVANDDFESRAYQALLTDPEFCKSILKSGAKSSKVALALAYGGMAMTVAPTAVIELKERKAEKDAREEQAANEDGS